MVQLKTWYKLQKQQHKSELNEYDNRKYMEEK